MNIYQNGEFSKNLHKLTKYQSLAATVNDMSKQTLYAQKVNEYKNKLDKIGSVQTGGLNATTQQKLSSVITRVREELVPKAYKVELARLSEAHNNLIGQINSISINIKSLIEEKENLQAQMEKEKAKFAAVMRDLAAKDPVIQTLQSELENATAAGQRYKREMSAKGLTKAELDRLQAELDEANALAARLRAEAAAKNPALLAIHEQTIAQLQAEMASLRADLLKAQTLLATQPPSGVENCDAAIQGVLNDIDAAITNRNQQDLPSVSIGPISQIAQDVIRKLTSI